MEEKTKAYKNRGELVFETLKREILDLELKPGPVSYTHLDVYKRQT